MKFQALAFEPGGKIPPVFTCDGKDINPAFEISDVPKEAKSLVFIMDDPDVPKFVREDGMYDHWVVYDIPPSVREIAEDSTPPGTVGVNTDGLQKYRGPCPPDREHRYFFKLYALDTKLGLPAGATKKQVEEKMRGHIIVQVEFMGRYKRIKKS